MLKEVTYVGDGSIDFALPSITRRFTLTKGKSVVINVNNNDSRTIMYLDRLGLKFKDYNNEVVTPAPVQEPVVEVKEEVEVQPETPAEEESTVAVEKPSYTLNALMKKNRASLVALADELGVVYPDNASKREIAELICS